VEVRPE